MTDPAHVLVVDDEKDFREATTMLLSLEGFRVSEASSGDEAIPLLQSTSSADRVDVVLLDYRMPGRNGGDTLKALRALGLKSRVILVTAASNFRNLGVKFGFDEVVPKPCDFNELLAAIQRCAACDGRDQGTFAAH
jgi:DNA-binding response OmpR family regulator